MKSQTFEALTHHRCPWFLSPSSEGFPYQTKQGCLQCASLRLIQDFCNLINLLHTFLLSWILCGKNEIHCHIPRPLHPRTSSIRFNTSCSISNIRVQVFTQLCHPEPKKKYQKYEKCEKCILNQQKLIARWSQSFQMSTARLPVQFSHCIFPPVQCMF